MSIPGRALSPLPGKPVQETARGSARKRRARCEPRSFSTSSAVPMRVRANRPRVASLQRFSQRLCGRLAPRRPCLWLPTLPLGWRKPREGGVCVRGFADHVSCGCAARYAHAHMCARECAPCAQLSFATRLLRSASSARAATQSLRLARIGQSRSPSRHTIVQIIPISTIRVGVTSGPHPRRTTSCPARSFWTE